MWWISFRLDNSVQESVSCIVKFSSVTHRGLHRLRGGPDCPLEDYETDASEPDRDDRHRIDYLFAEEPTADHAFDLDFTRIRRLSGWRGSGGDQTAGDPDAFFRDLEEKENPKYLSDHFGLDVQFIASPRQP